MSGVFVYFPPGPDGKSSEGSTNSSGGIYILRLSNPPLNILNKATRLKLLHDLEQAVNDPKVKTIILVGSEAAFSAGADINELNSVVIGHGKDSKKAAMQAYVDAYREHNLASIVYAIDSCPKPVVALITGQCLGGGLELALGCQYRIATEDAMFRFPEALIGIIPGALGTQLLPRLVKFNLCLRMCSGACEGLSAKQALESGLIDQVLPPLTELEMPAGTNQRLESYLARVVKVVQGQMERGGPTPYRRTSELAVVTRSMADSSREAYLAMKTLPRADRGGAASRGAIEALLACVQNERDFLYGAKVESEVSTRSVVSDEAQGLRWAFFAEKALTSSSSGTGAIDKKTGMNPLATTSIGVVGSGLMGSGIAASVLLSGFSVILCDLNQDALTRARTTIEGIARSAVKRGKVGRATAETLLAKSLSTSTDLTTLKNADYVIEAVYESYDVKKDVMQKLDSICKSECILCSNTSSLDVDVLAEVTSRPSKVLGLHFFSPAHVMKLVEIVKCKGTSAETLVLMTDLVKKIRKVGVLVTNLPGFVGNRMIFVYVMEAMLLLEDGASVKQVDTVMRRFGMAMGPLEMSDLSGLDIGYSIRQARGLTSLNTEEGIGREVEATRYSAIADILFKMGRKGVKSGQGFYSYASSSEPSKGRGGRRTNKPVAREDPEVAAVIERERHRKSVSEAAAKESVSSGLYVPSSALVDSPRSKVEAEVQTRLLYSLINEGFRLLGEGGVVSYRPGDIDIVYTYGYGWPAYKGGPMFYADFAIGLPTLLAGLKHYLASFPTATWFKPAPLLEAMVAQGVAVNQLQRDPSLVPKLMTSKNVNGEGHIKSKL